MKRNMVLAMLLVCLVVPFMAQTINWGNSTGKTRVKGDSIAKTILEPTKYMATYAYTFVRDADHPEDKRQGFTILEMGDNYNRFCDYYELAFDSICDAVSREKIPAAEASAVMLSTLKKAQFKEGIVFDKNKSQYIVQRTAGLRNKKYQYVENCPQMKWKLLEGDTTIAGYKCNKAETELFGRTYIAWYSPDIAMPYGPYKFNGLPGLVLRVTDTKGHFDFILNGLEKVNSYKPIYLWARADIVKTNRETVRKIYKNYCADPTSALTNSGVIIPDDVKATVSAKPYNPMEME